MIEITEEMLDAIEAVKGRREPQYWDPRCRRYMEQNKKGVKKPKKSKYIYKSFFLLLWLLLKAMSGKSNLTMVARL